MTDTDATPVEMAAQLIHQLHRAGTANVCDGCREVAREVAEVLDVERLRGIEQRARDIFNGPNVQDARTARYILGDDDA